MTMTTDAEALDLQDAPRDVPLGTLVPALTALAGEIPPHLVPTSCKSGLLNNAPRWEQLAAATIADVLLWSGVGLGRAEHILRFASRSHEFQPTTVPTEVRAVAARSEIDAALRLLAAWAIHCGGTTGLEEATQSARRPGTPPSVVAAADLLETIDLTTIALSPEERSFDHGQAALRLLASFEGRDLAILERVLAAGLRAVPTLEEIGDRFGITRERVRQLQGPLEETLERRLRTEEFDVLVGHAQVLSAQVGVACPVTHLPAELQPGSSLADELFAYLAGPYRLADGWLVRRDLGTSPGDLAKGTFDSVASDDGIVPADALFDALSSAGVEPRWHLALLRGADRIAVLGGHYVRWGTHVERLTSMLATAGRPMTSDELAAQARSVEPDIQVRSLLNRLADDDFRRIGRDRYALAAWEGDEYRGIVSEMETALAGGQQPIAGLSTDLADRFGVAAASVAMYATMHPKFVADDGVVRLRRDDEPYEIRTTLEESARCYLIDGAWSWRVPVDRDLLRGSGRAIPEAFAADLGATPTHPVVLKAGDQDLKIGWAMKPHVGSLRRRAEELELVEGDWMFVRHSSSAGVTFLPLPNWKVQAATPDERVRLLVGASEDDDRDLARCVADALGIADTRVELAACVRVLEARGEADVLEALGYGGLG
jgi:hypothetical protein